MEPAKTSAPPSNTMPSMNEIDVERLPILEQLELELGKLREPVRNMTEWLQTLELKFDSQINPLKVIQADLDRDGVSNEWVTVLQESIRNKETGEVEQRTAYGVVIQYKDNKFTFQSVPFTRDNYGRVTIEAVKDLTDDGRPDIVWMSLNIGAHTTFSTYSVSTYEEGRLDTIKGTAEIVSITRAEILEGKMLLTGGLIDSVGAGPWQREFRDTYSIVNNELKKTERVFTSSLTPYHRLMDGLWSVAYGHIERALREYTEAASMEGTSYKNYAFIFGSEWVEGDVKIDQEAEFERVVKQFSLLREELLTEIAKGKSHINACRIAKKKSGFEDDWITYLNSPAGYANPQWNKESVCSSMEEITAKF